jgi:small subunit ribosomal protein S21
LAVAAAEPEAALPDLEGGTFVPPARAADPRFSIPEDAPWRHVYVRNGNVEEAIKTLRKRMNQSNILRELRTRRTFENNHDKQIRKYKEALRRKAFDRKRARRFANGN